MLSPQISTPPFVEVHWYSQPVAYGAVEVVPQPGLHCWILHCVFAGVQASPAPAVVSHAGVPLMTTQVLPHLPQSVVLVQRSTSSSFTPSQSSSLLLQSASSGVFWMQ